MHVVVWDSRTSSGHQAVMDKGKAEQISRVLGRAMPDAQIRVLPAWEHGANAVCERQQRQQLRR